MLSRTGTSNIPAAASLAQSLTGLLVIGGFALTGAQPMQDLFFDLGTTGGFGVLLLYALTSAAVIAFFARDPRRETAWARLIAPALALVLLTAIAVLAVTHYASLLGVAPGSAAAWALPASYAAAAAAGLAWGLTLRIRRPRRVRRPSASAPTPPRSRPGPGHDRPRRQARRASSAPARPTPKRSPRSSPTRSSPSPPANG